LKESAMVNATYEKRGAVGVILVDYPPVNAISHGVRLGISQGLQQAAADADIKAVVLACAGRTFMAGADITEFGKPKKHPVLQEVLAEMEALSKPIVAAIHGTAFGGGLETALTCDYRIALSSAQIGLPEVKLGIIPGAGGTQRLPRVYGVEKSLAAITSGDPIPVKKATGVIDRIVEDNLVDAAVAFANEIIAQGAQRRKISAMTIDPASFPADLFDQTRKALAKSKRNMNSPQRAVDAVEASVTRPFAEGMKYETDLILGCFDNPQSAAMRHVFFAEREVARIPGIGKDIKPRPVARVGIIGAGTMGGGIAMNFANVGIPVVVIEAAQEGLDRGLGVVRRNYESTAKKGKLTAEQVEQRMGLIQPSLSYDDLGDCDFIIEAVFETMDIKRQVFGKLDAVAKPGAILASNTSYLSVDAIADVTSRPGDVLGTHFFSPANVMRLCEVVRGARTAPDALLTAMDVAKRIRKIGVVAGNCDGFIGNRMLTGYTRQANMLLVEGAAPEQVDKVLYDFGMPMGPFQMGDLAGLDVSYKSRKDRDPATLEQRAIIVPNRLVEMGRHGQKTSAGYYDYDAGDRTPKPSAITAEQAARAASELGITPRRISDQEILERCFFAMVNIGAEILREGIAYRSCDIDIVYINGYGFPIYRGGPMFWSENEVGLKAVLDGVRGYAKQCGERWWTPSPLLEQLVAESRGFASVSNAG